ncbi:MAG TPA: hypothetical protein VGG64_08835 [Pirellulales bacterium]|jgi:hypothetical protein
MNTAPQFKRFGLALAVWWSVVVLVALVLSGWRLAHPSYSSPAICTNCDRGAVKIPKGTARTDFEFKGATCASCGCRVRGPSAFR